MTGINTVTGIQDWSKAKVGDSVCVEFANEPINAKIHAIKNDNGVMQSMTLIVNINGEDL